MSPLLPYAGPAARLGAGPAARLGAGAVSFFQSGQAAKKADALAANQNPQMPNPYANGNPLATALDLQNQANNNEAGLIREQGAIAQSEAGRTAVQTAREGRKFGSSQAEQFSSNGIRTNQSPSALAVMEETRQLNNQELQAQIARGAAQATLANRQADIASMRGRAAILGSQANWDAQGTQFAAQQALARVPAIRQSSTPGGLSSLLGTIGDSITGISALHVKNQRDPQQIPPTAPPPPGGLNKSPVIPDPAPLRQQGSGPYGTSQLDPRYHPNSWWNQPDP